MIRLYRQLKELGMKSRFFCFYTVSLLIGAVLTYALFIFGNYLQFFGFVILLRAVLQPYFHFRMRLPLYIAKKEIKNEKGECNEMLSDYYDFNLFFWKQDYLRARVFDYSELVTTALVLVLGSCAVLTSEQFASQLSAIIITSVGIIFLMFLEIRHFDYICEECEKGEAWFEL